MIHMRCDCGYEAYFHNKDPEGGRQIGLPCLVCAGKNPRDLWFEPTPALRSLQIGGYFLGIAQARPLRIIRWSVTDTLKADVAWVCVHAGGENFEGQFMVAVHKLAAQPLSAMFAMVKPQRRHSEPIQPEDLPANVCDLAVSLATVLEWKARTPEDWNLWLAFEMQKGKTV